jgi:hypothetical protein
VSCNYIVFAVNRTANVPGRIKFLMVSMHTINGIMAAGVPWGTRCSNMWLVLLINPNKMNPTHIGNANVNVTVRWLVLVKIWGNNPRKLKRISKNNDTKRKALPFLLPRRGLNSLCNLIVNRFRTAR